MTVLTPEQNSVALCGCNLWLEPLKSRQLAEFGESDAETLRLVKAGRPCSVRYRV